MLIINDENGYTVIPAPDLGVLYSTKRKNTDSQKFTSGTNELKGCQAQMNLNVFKEKISYIFYCVTLWTPHQLPYLSGTNKQKKSVKIITVTIWMSLQSLSPQTHNLLNLLLSPSLLLW